MKQVFEESLAICRDYFNNGEHFNFTFNGEDSTFVRLNRSLVRQSTSVTQATVSLELISGQKKAEMEVGLSIDLELNKSSLLQMCTHLQKEIESLPEHPFIVLPQVSEQSCVEHTGELPDSDEFFALLKNELSHVDLAGYLTSGTVYRGSGNSKGAKHWFSSPSFFFDYSLYTAKEKAVKGLYAGKVFDKSELKKNLERDILALEFMSKENVVLKPGKYRVYLAPAAMSELCGTLEWGAFSMGGYKREQSPLKSLKEGNRNWSPQINMMEDFSLGLVPSFNELGEVSKEKLPLIENGKLINLLTSSQTAKEYNLESNQASGRESMRSLHIKSGSLKEEDAFKELGTGLYISNLHYLNWSDLVGARITGMTRFGCLWVEDGKPVGPIKDMRFDETLHQIFGEGLEHLTNFSQEFLTTGTYYQRNIGGAKVPGAIVNDFSLTL